MTCITEITWSKDSLTLQIPRFSSQFCPTERLLPQRPVSNRAVWLGGLSTVRQFYLWFPLGFPSPSLFPVSFRQYSFDPSRRIISVPLTEFLFPFPHHRYLELHIFIFFSFLWFWRPLLFFSPSLLKTRVRIFLKVGTLPDNRCESLPEPTCSLPCSPYWLIRP